MKTEELVKQLAKTLTKELKVVPKTPAAKADRLYALRELRYSVQHIAEDLERCEKDIKDYFINTLHKDDATGISGAVAQVAVETKPVPIVDDWDAFYKYVKKNDAFFLLQKRVSESAVKEIWENKKTVPGVTRLNAKTVSCTKLKTKRAS